MREVDTDLKAGAENSQGMESIARSAETTSAAVASVSSVAPARLPAWRSSCSS